MAQHQRTRRCDLRQTQQAATAFRRLVGGLAAEILRFDFSCVCVAQRCSARIAIHEAHRVLPDTRVLRGVFRALGIVPGYPSFVQFCAELILHLRFYPVKKFTKLFYVGSTEKSAMARERPLSQLCPLNSPCGTGHKRRTSELGFRSLSPKVLHQNFFEAASKPSFKRCSLRSIFLLFPGGFAFAKALLNLRMPPSLGKPASSDFGVKKRRKQVLQPAETAFRGLPTPLYAIFEKPAFRTKEATWVLLTQLGSNTLQHFETAKRLRCTVRSALAKHLPAYMAPVALRAITSALQFRGHRARPSATGPCECHSWPMLRIEINSGLACVPTLKLSLLSMCPSPLWFSHDTRTLHRHCATAKTHRDSGQQSVSHHVVVRLATPSLQVFTSSAVFPLWKSR